MPLILVKLSFRYYELRHMSMENILISLDT